MHHFLFIRHLIFLYGLGVWLAATLALRIAGQHLLRPGDWARTSIIFAVSFPASAYITRVLCRRFKLRREEWGAGATTLLLPTLLIDPFSTVFFPFVFPNMAPEVAGTFGGLMLWCCAGALVGISLSSGKRT
jgi:hypothetical protein